MSRTVHWHREPFRRFALRWGLVRHHEIARRPRADEDPVVAWHEYDDTVRWKRDPATPQDPRRDSSSLDYTRNDGRAEYDAKCRHIRGRRSRRARYLRELASLDQQIEKAAQMVHVCGDGPLAATAIKKYIELLNQRHELRATRGRRDPWATIVVDEEYASDS